MISLRSTLVVYIFCYFLVTTCRSFTINRSVSSCGNVRSQKRLLSQRIMSSADSSSLMQCAVLDSNPHAPVGSRFCFCSVCRSAFLFSASQLESKGNLVRCSICEKEWYQSTDRLQRSDELDYFTFLSEDHVSTVKNTLKENKKIKNTRNKFEVFVGNIPTSWQEKDLLDIFADYGILSVTLSRDSFGECKGFGFVEVIAIVNKECCCSALIHLFYL